GGPPRWRAGPSGGLAIPPVAASSSSSQLGFASVFGAGGGGLAAAGLAPGLASLPGLVGWPGLAGLDGLASCSSGSWATNACPQCLHLIFLPKYCVGTFSGLSQFGQVIAAVADMGGSSWRFGGAGGGTGRERRH